MAGLKVEVIEGPDAGLQVPLDRSLVIGRGDGADLRLADAHVSHRHARLTAAHGDIVVDDLASTNGTFVNGSPLHGPVPLHPGDELWLGTSVLRMRTAEEVAAQASALRNVPPALVAPERPPTYVKVPVGPKRAPVPTGPSELTSLLDVRTRAQARLAPLALLVLVAFALVIYFAAR